MCEAMHDANFFFPKNHDETAVMSLAAGVASVNSLGDESDPIRGDAMKAAPIPQEVYSQSEHIPSSAPIVVAHGFAPRVSVTGAKLDLQWRELRNVEYLTDGGNSWIHTATLDGKPVVVKTLKPECQDLAVAINEIESELGECHLGVWSKLVCFYTITSSCRN
jgi:hypothetical protein